VKRAARFLTVLLTICVFSAGSVGTTYFMVSKSIEQKKRQVKEEAVEFVLPDAARIDASIYPCGPGEDDDIIVGTDGAGNIVGYAATGKAMGYSDKIEVLVGVEPPLERPRIIAIKILAQSETPGLGAKVGEVETEETIWSAIGGLFSGKKAGVEKVVREPWFQKQFRDKTLEQLVVVKTGEPDKIQAITAATISSKATTKAVRSAVERIVQEVLKKEEREEGGS